jgi:methylmalonyl-CoA mutase
MSDLFGQQSYTAWLSQFAKELKTDQPEQKLLKQFQDISIKAYYPLNETIYSNPETVKQWIESGYSYTGNWIVQITIPTHDIVKANKLALHALENGASSLRFTGSSVSTPSELILLLKDIQLDVIQITFDCGEANLSLLYMWLDELKRRNLSSNKAQASFCFDAYTEPLFSGESSFTSNDVQALINELISINQNQTIPLLGVAAHRYVQAGSFLSFELAAALAISTEYLHKASKTDWALKSIFWQLSSGSEYLAEIAKFRAARLLWSQLIDSFGFNAAANPLHIQALILPEYYTLYEPLNNLLRASTGAMAAIIGGADTVNTPPHDALFTDYNHESTRRAVHIHQMLRFESHLDKVADMSKGSQYIEHFTQLLAQKAWSRFQEIEAKGGWLACVNSGWVKEQVLAEKALLQKQFDTGKKKIVGIHYSVDLSQKSEKELPYRLATYQPTENKLNNWRRTEELEYFRKQISESDASEITLYTGQDRKMSKARVAFCEDFLAAGGFKTQIKSQLSGNEAIVVLCGANEEYPAMLSTLVNFKGKKWIAGLPENSDELKKLGASDFIYAGCHQMEKLISIAETLNKTVVL